MSDPHSPRPLEDADAVDAAWEGEPRTWVGRELVYNEAVAASAVIRVEDAVLAAVRDQVERLTQLDATWEGDTDWTLVVRLADVLAILGPEAAIRSAGTPPATERRPVHVHDYGAAQIPCSQDCLAATPPEPVGGRDREPEHEPWCWRRHTGHCVDGPSDVALQASPPTGVSDDQCPERCLGIVGHAGPHQTSDYEPPLRIEHAAVDARDRELRAAIEALDCWLSGPSVVGIVHDEGLVTVGRDAVLALLDSAPADAG